MLYNVLLIYKEFECLSKYDSIYSYYNKVLDGMLYNVLFKYFDMKYRSKYVYVYENEKLDGILYKVLLRYLGFKYEGKFDRSYYNWYDDFFMNMENRYFIKEFKEIYDGEKFSWGFKGD